MITVIEKESRFRLVKWSELLHYRDLLYFLVVRGVKAKYAQSVLGIGWAVLQPLLTMLIFTVVFGNLAKISSDGVPYVLFSFSGLMAWTYFSGALSDASLSLVANANMLTKVYFPRLILPLSSLISKLLDFVISVIMMIALLAVYRYPVSLNLLYFPLMVLLLFLTTLGPAILLSAWAVQYRDVKYGLNFIVQILLYTVPVVYPLSNVPKNYQLIYTLNPLVGVVEGFRVSILNTHAMPWTAIGISIMVSLIFAIFGLMSFSRLEKSFADIV